MRSRKQAASLTVLGAAMLIGTVLLARPAHASYVVTLTEQGSNLVASGSGTLDLADLSSAGSSSLVTSAIQPNGGLIALGVLSGSSDIYNNATGPSSFGPGSDQTFADSATGPFAGIYANQIFVPGGYVSGTSLTNTATFDNASYSSLGVTPGTYAWSWGTGISADSFTLDVIAPASVPEPSSFFLLLGGLGALPFMRQTCRRRPRQA